VRQPSAIAGSALFFLLAPGVVAGVMPWILTGGYDHPLTESRAAIVLGGVIIAAAAAFLVHAFLRFALEGGGTPAPVAPTERLVVGGIYRHVRNPMYIAVVSIILGQALLFSSWGLVAYAAIVSATMAAFVRLYEEPTLAARYGAEYDAYRCAVPAWLPRLTPWRGDGPPG
jgi:protein-S-isoprenylcysteine O-methyltransferase Ste14